MTGSNGVPVLDKVLGALREDRDAGRPERGRRALARDLRLPEYQVRQALDAYRNAHPGARDEQGGRPGDERDDQRAPDPDPTPTPAEPALTDRPQSETDTPAQSPAGARPAPTSPTTLSSVAARVISGLARWIDPRDADQVGVGDAAGEDDNPPTPPTPTAQAPAEPPRVVVDARPGETRDEPEPARLADDPPPTSPTTQPQAAGDARADEWAPVTTSLWPVVLIALAAAIAVWGGWVDIGRMTGFGLVQPLPGLWDDLRINTAVALPIGIEAYGGFALRVWLSFSATRSRRTRTFACISAWASLLVGAGAQVASHLMRAAGMTTAPWQVTVAVACVPVAVLGLATGLATLVRQDAARAGGGR